jgi:hypothetical protein
MFIFILLVFSSQHVLPLGLDVHPHKQLIDHACLCVIKKKFMAIKVLARKNESTIPTKTPIYPNCCRAPTAKQPTFHAYLCHFNNKPYFAF